MISKDNLSTSSTQPKVKNPKKVEAGKKGALVKKLKKEQIEKELKELKEKEFKEKETERITVNNDKNENQITHLPPAIVIKHGNVIDYGLMGILVICIGYVSYRKIKRHFKNTENQSQEHISTTSIIKPKFDKLDMK